MINLLIFFHRYKIEKKDTKRGTWMPVSSNITDTKFTVPKLVEGHEYEFRVVAENDQGESEPLVTMRPVVAKDPFSKLSFAIELQRLYLINHAVIHQGAESVKMLMHNFLGFLGWR